MSDDTTPPDEPETPENGGGPPRPQDGIELISIESEMKSSYLDYAMSVIVSRALPDVRDGLKPVHRRILYATRTATARSMTRWCAWRSPSRWA